MTFNTISSSVREASMGKISKLESLSESNLLRLYADLMEELRHRQVIRTSNNPVADYDEKVAGEHLRLKRAGKEERGYDALDAEGHRYQIKGRRVTRHNASRQLSVIRDLDQKLFDYLIAVIFDQKFNIQEIWQIPYEFVRGNSRWSQHLNGHIFYAKPEVLQSSKDVKRIL